MNRNRQVSISDYADCVEQQVEFLHEQDGSPNSARMVTDTDVREFYDNGVSVDAAASDLFYRGF